MEIKPTQEQYESLQQIYDFMNQQLFGGQLPAALITFHKEARQLRLLCPGSMGASI